ncbi:MAG: acylphosphatase [Candidatus Methanoperedens sp.]
MATSTHSITITGKVQDIGFRDTIEHIGRAFGLPGMVFNAKDGSVKILCSGENTVINNFTREIKVRGTESGAEIAGIKDQNLSINIELPDNFTKVSSDDDIDIGRKLDKANVLLSTLILDNRDGFNKLNTDLNTGFNNLTKMISEHNTRLEAILERLAAK